MRPTKEGQSVAPNSLAEVLIIDDDDGNLNNGTPNETVICDIFANRHIWFEIDSLLCSGDSVPASSTMPDCDGSGTLDIFDYVCFSNLYNSGSANADVTQDGLLDTRDYIAFGDIYVETKNH